jgi:hypothetical protein
MKILAANVTKKVVLYGQTLFNITECNLKNRTENKDLGIIWHKKMTV